MPEFSSQPIDVDPSTPSEVMRPLLRMRQLSIEIERGVETDNLDLVCRAAALLAPTLARMKSAQPDLDVTAGEAAQIALDTSNCLKRSERTLEEAMDRIAAEMRRIQRGTRRLATIRSRFLRTSPARRLDTRK